MPIPNPSPGPKARTRFWPASPASPNAPRSCKPLNLCHEPLLQDTRVAPNKFLAKLASDWRNPDGLFVIQPEEADAFLLPLPLGGCPESEKSPKRSWRNSN